MAQLAAPSIEETVLRMKTEIATDVVEGTVPDDVPSFSALHDYVDANCYGGMCDSGLPERFGSIDAWIAHANEAQTAVDKWIRSGMVLDFPFVYRSKAAA